MVGNFKSLVTRRTKGAPVWQRGHYERVVGNERQLNAIRQYIADNPASWILDRYYGRSLLEPGREVE
jgi:REP element-mobilizing transposase RayT